MESHWPARSATGRAAARKTIDLAPEGDGAHGTLTRGVLDLFHHNHFARRAARRGSARRRMKLLQSRYCARFLLEERALAGGYNRTGLVLWLESPSDPKGALTRENGPVSIGGLHERETLFGFDVLAARRRFPSCRFRRRICRPSDPLGPALTCPFSRLRPPRRRSRKG